MKINIKLKFILLFLIILLLPCGTVLAQQQGNLEVAQGNENVSVFKQVRWSPYAVGAGIGLLSVLTFFFSNEAIGVSGAYART